MSISLKKINFNKNNFNYYFKIIFGFRNNSDYLKLNKIKKVSRNNSYNWLLNNKRKRIFFLIKYKKKKCWNF